MRSKVMVLPHAVEAYSGRSLFTLLKKIVNSDDTVYSDDGEDVDTVTGLFHERPGSFYQRMEEAYKLKMQISYMFTQRCRVPLEKLSNQKSFKTLTDAFDM